MIFLAGHYDVCRRYVRDKGLGRERYDWVHVRRIDQLRGIRGKYRDPDSPHYMVVLHYDPGYVEDERAFFELVRLQGLLPRGNACHSS